MHSTKRAPIASKQPVHHREWIASREALRLVSEVYALHDLEEYESEEQRKRAASARAADAMLRRLTEGTLLARPAWFHFVQGSHNDGTEHVIRLPEKDRVISPNFWRILRRVQALAAIDWTAGDFSFDDFDAGVYAIGSATSVKFDRVGLPALDLLSSKPKPNTGGATRKWDWDGALVHLAALAHDSPNGLFRDDGNDPNQSDIARHLQAWFISTRGDAPEDSQLRKYGRLFVIELNAVKSRAANNL